MTLHAPSLALRRAAGFPVSDPKRTSAPLHSAWRPLSVGIYMHDFSGGGIERQCLMLGQALQERGHDVTLIVHQVRGELKSMVPEGVRVVDLRARRTIGDIPKLAAYLRRNRPDVLLANFDHNNVAALLAKALSGTATRVVICQHNVLPGGPPAIGGWKDRVIPLSYRHLSFLASGVVAVSGGLADELVQRACIPRSKVLTINNPVIDSNFTARAGAPASHPWFEHGGPPVMLTAGRLVHEKDHETLLRGFALHLRTAEARLMILGAGPLRPSLEALTRELRIDQAVAFLGFQSNPLPLIARADAFVLTSRVEGFGNVLVEALACGTPVIATNCPYGPTEILDNGRYGVLVPPQNPQRLAEELAGIGLLRRRWPAASLKARAHQFTITACADRYDELFQRISRKLELAV
jgi:glycosyltransferase involved in cell wall biosynthesis